MASPDHIVAGGGTPNRTDQHLKALAKFLGLREDFLVELFDDPDDWSFVVKAHAFLESVICTLLSLHLRKPALEEVLAEKVEMHARIEMTKALGLTTSLDRKAMRDLGTLRNRLVHNASETSFTFAAYFESKALKKNFTDTFGQGLPDHLGTPPVERSEFVEKNPKFAVFQAVLRIALYVVTEAKKIQTETAIEGLRRAAPTIGEEPSPRETAAT
jgi:hypothetical protein